MNGDPDGWARYALVMGGCHVTSFGLGNDPPFWADLVRRWKATSVDVRGQVSIARARTIVTTLAPLPADTLVVLQVGHYDIWRELALLNPISAREDRRGREGKEGQETSSTETISPTSSATLLKSIVSTFVRGGLLLATDRLLIGPKRLQQALAGLEHQFEGLLRDLEDAGAANIIVLSAFPTASPRLNAFRRQISRIMERVTQRKGHVFVDAWGKLGLGAGPFLLPRQGTVLDAVHLSADGHAQVARLLERLPILDDATCLRHSRTGRSLPSIPA